MTRGLPNANCLGDLARIPVERFVASFASLNEPVVVTGVAERWPALELWTAESLRERLGLDDESTAQRLTSELEAEVEFLPLASRRKHANVWVGKDGYVTQLHYDLPHNLNTVLRGEKDFLVFPPGETKNLYPYSIFDDAGPLNSRVILDDVDPRFSRVLRARFWRTTIAPGETLYLPPFFWHHVRSRGESVAANVWFYTERSSLRRIARWPRGALGYAGVNIVRRLLERASPRSRSA